MPHIEIRDYSGYTRTLDSSDPGIIAHWLLEQASELVNVNMTLSPVQLTIYPRYVFDSRSKRDVEDWQSGFRNIPLDEKKLLSLQDWLTAWQRSTELADAARPDRTNARINATNADPVTVSESPPTTNVVNVQNPEPSQSPE